MIKIKQKLKFMSLQTVIPSVDKICTRLFRLLIYCLQNVILFKIVLKLAARLTTYGKPMQLKI